MKKNYTRYRSGTIESYISKNTCVLCGNDRIENGKIFRGHCVCESCVEYVASMPDTRSSVNESAIMESDVVKHGSIGEF